MFLLAACFVAFQVASQAVRMPQLDVSQRQRDCLQRYGPDPQTGAEHRRCLLFVVLWFVCVCACEDDEVELQMLDNLGVKSYCFRECTVPRVKSVKRSHVFSHTEAHTAQAGRSCVLRCLSPSTKPQRAYLAPAFIARILRPNQ